MDKDKEIKKIINKSARRIIYYIHCPFCFSNARTVEEMLHEILDIIETNE